MVGTIVPRDTTVKRKFEKGILSEDDILNSYHCCFYKYTCFFNFFSLFMIFDFLHCTQIMFQHCAKNQPDIHSHCFKMVFGTLVFIKQIGVVVFYN